MDDRSGGTTTHGGQMTPGARVIITLYTATLREGTAWVALVLEEHAALGPLDLHFFHTDRVFLVLTPSALLA
jgi:hypothetical protein